MYLTRADSCAGKENGNNVDCEKLSSKHKDAQVRTFWTLSPSYSLVFLLPLLALVGRYCDSSVSCQNVSA